MDQHHQHDRRLGSSLFLLILVTRARGTDSHQTRRLESESLCFGLTERRICLACTIDCFSCR